MPYWTRVELYTGRVNSNTEKTYKLNIECKMLNQYVDYCSCKRKVAISSQVKFLLRQSWRGAAPKVIEVGGARAPSAPAVPRTMNKGVEVPLKSDT